MGLIKTFKGFYAGGFFQYTYSPKYPDLLSEYDKYPLVLWVNYDNSIRLNGKGPMNLMSGINVHFLTPPQRKELIDNLVRVYKQPGTKHEYGRPINITWQVIKSWNPIFGFAWRRYFPNRVRSITPIASTWDYEELTRDVINSDTANIIGITSEVLQQKYIETTQRKLRAERARITAIQAKKQAERARVAAMRAKKK